MYAHSILAVSLFAITFCAEIIDRVAVTIDNQVITASELALEIRLTAFLNAETPDFSSAARRAAAGRLVEQKLIRREMQVGRYAAPSPEEAEPLLQQVRHQRFQNPEEYRPALDHYGITEEELKAHLLWQLTLLRFVDVRFRPAVQVTDAEIQAYFDANRAALQPSSENTRVLTLDDLRSRIRDILTDQGADKQLDEWLSQARKRARIEFHPEAFQ